jgi:ketosteroid isomerase-like protein
MTRLLILALLFLAGPALALPRQAEVEQLLAADRAFSAAAARAPSAADGLAPMFDAEAVMPVPGPGPGFATGRDAVVAAFRDSPAFREGRLSWAPIRGGISADGLHGFTYGYLSLSGGDPARRNRKYLAYWIRRPGGWRVAAYRQLPRAPGEVATAMLPPSLPAFTARPTTGLARIEAHRASLHAAEQAFSDRAQHIGLRAAFREYGRADAMNMGGPGPIQVGLDAVTAGFPEGETISPVSWGTERSFVASSGDLGVSIGIIRGNSPAADGQSPRFPFFTIWRRDRPGAPWRYVAE